MKGVKHMRRGVGSREHAAWRRFRGISSVCVNIWWEGMKRSEPGFSQCCPLTGGSGRKLKSRKFHLNIRKHLKSPWGWLSTGTGCPERQWSLRPWTRSKPSWARSWATCFGLPLLEWGGGWDDLQKSLMTRTILWGKQLHFYASVLAFGRVEGWWYV